MTYLSVSNFWKYQNADAWKKAKAHPPWFKHYVHRDQGLDRLPPLARLLFYELLAAATRYSNVLEADLKWIWAETRVEPEVIAEMLPLLLKGGWLSQTETKRRSRKPSRANLPDPLPLSRLEVKDKEKTLPLTYTVVRGVQAEPVSHETEVNGNGHDPLEPIAALVDRSLRTLNPTPRYPDAA